MQIFDNKNALESYLKSFSVHQSVGFVATMGALHEGHLSLIKLSNTQCDITICSIFINPTQFNNSKDFTNYPNTIKDDLSKLKTFNCDIVYTPTINDLYGSKIESKKYNLGKIMTIMEGEFRPGHFNGMATVVEKFLTIIKPSKAFFGQKDLQQLQIIKKLVKQMPLNIEIISGKTIRDKNGLALSSRNKLLNTSEKQNAKHIYKSLQYCKKNKHVKVINLKKHVKKYLKINNIDLEYIEFIDLENMKIINQLGEKNKNAICIAAYLNEVRLIDNIIL